MVLQHATPADENGAAVSLNVTVPVPYASHSLRNKSLPRPAGQALPHQRPTINGRGPDSASDSCPAATAAVSTKTRRRRRQRVRGKTVSTRSMWSRNSRMYVRRNCAVDSSETEPSSP